VGKEDITVVAVVFLSKIKSLTIAKEMRMCVLTGIVEATERESLRQLADFE
jgi:hypothetical protein